jgi:DNA-directed RNA polymerase subunit D
MVTVKIQELQDRKARLFIEDATPYFVNSLRRVLVSEVPKMAIEDVIIYDNNSGLFDEIVAHRLGLLPVPTDLNLFKSRAECQGNREPGAAACKGCPTCTIRYTLSKEGPGTVFSRDLQPENPAHAIADPNIPIVELLKSQRLILEAEAIIGTGRDHAKWQVCSGVGYKYAPTVKIHQDQVTNAEAIAKSCPVDVFDAKKGKLEVVNEPACILCMACVEKDAELQGKQPIKREEEGKSPALTIRGDASKFVFKFETDGSMKPQAALLKAVELMKLRLEEFEEKAQRLKVVETQV